MFFLKEIYYFHYIIQTLVHLLRILKVMTFMSTCEKHGILLLFYELVSYIVKYIDAVKLPTQKAVLHSFYADEVIEPTH